MAIQVDIGSVTFSLSPADMTDIPELQDDILKSFDKAWERRHGPYLINVPAYNSDPSLEE